MVIPCRESETKHEKHIQMDYWIRAGAYLLRPEVSQRFPEDFGQNQLTTFERPWNRFTFYG